MNWAGPERMVSCSDTDTCASQVVARLRELGVAAQTPATGTIGWDQRTAAPPRKGMCRLIDGTVVMVSGERDVAGDVIETNLWVNGWRVEAKAVGLLAVKLDHDGNLEALAAGGLKSFRAGALNLSLDPPVDLALWREAQGPLRGALQDWLGPVPPPLAQLTTHWLRLAVPKRPGDN